MICARCTNRTAAVRLATISSSSSICRSVTWIFAAFPGIVWPPLTAVKLGQSANGVATDAVQPRSIQETDARAAAAKQKTKRRAVWGRAVAADRSSKSGSKSRGSRNHGRFIAPLATPKNHNPRAKKSCFHLQQSHPPQPTPQRKSRAKAIGGLADQQIDPTERPHPGDRARQHRLPVAAVGRNRRCSSPPPSPESAR